ncbi:tyrosine-protein kinase Wzc [Nonlabens ulvanivorans]|uniref:Tyrosine-protein kinase Wzc n=1 Tax=Nonlabens ulvanivorans TaxID=906888 RepID=A0A081DES6_NONUL|nr:tyrosine-protein kinase Wzc [Nonlabens ulvanivorans]
MEEEKEINSLSGIFDIRQFFTKLIKLWWLIVICLGIGLGYATIKISLYRLFIVQVL